MGIIEAAKLVFEYAKYSEEGSVESVVRAIWMFFQDSLLQF